MESSEEDEDEAKYYSNIYYVDKMTVEKSINTNAVRAKSPDNATKRVLSKRYWSMSDAQISNTLSQNPQSKDGSRQKSELSKSPSKSEKIRKSPFNSIAKKEKSNPKHKGIKKSNSKFNLTNAINLISNILNGKLKATKSNSDSIDESKSKSDQNNTTVVENASSTSDSNNQNVKIITPTANTSSTINEEADSTTSENGKILIKQNDITDNIIDLEASDNESVVEVEIPHQSHPTICIDSSDDEMISKTKSSVTTSSNSNSTKIVERGNTSPVPSVVSSTSDDFIQNDCRNLNISAKKDSSNMKFNFQLHGAEFAVKSSDNNNKNSNSGADFVLLDKNVSTPKSKSTQSQFISKDNQTFATPKNKSKKKNANKVTNDYTISNESFVPFSDVYESESSDFPDSVVDVPIKPTFLQKNLNQSKSEKFKNIFTDLVDDTLIMANVIGMDDQNAVNNNCTIDVDDIVEETDTNFLNRNSEFIEKKSIAECILEMDRFYNQSWGGENFDHIKIQKELPSSKNLWAIDPSDKYRDVYKKVQKDFCLLCNKNGHREDRCNRRVAKCYMCGMSGHPRSKCPNTLCLNCGSKTNSFTLRCPTCKKWKNLKCTICHKPGHPKNNCPDLWRRYHLTLRNEIPLIKDTSKKSSANMYCSNCAKRGHIVGNCNVRDLQYIPSTSLICEYTPVYVPEGVRNKGPCSDNIQSLTKNNPTPENYNKRKMESSTEQNPNKKTKYDENNCESFIKSDKSVSHAFLSVNQVQELNSEEGSKLFESITLKCNVNCKIYFSIMGPVLFITGSYNNQRIFKEELGECFKFSDSCVALDKYKLIKDISNELNMLSSFIGNPIKLFNSLENLQNCLRNKIIKEKSSLELALLTKDIDDICKKLNIILIGQVGFCNGKECVLKLREEVNKLRQSISNNVSSNMKISLAKWYFSIFSPLSRENYLEMLINFRERLHTFPSWLKRHINLRKHRILGDPLDVSQKKNSKKIYRSGKNS